MDSAIIIIISKILDVLSGVILLSISYWRLRSSNNGLSVKDMLRELEEKDREVEKLKLEVQLWKKHHERATKVSHLHFPKKA